LCYRLAALQKSGDTAWKKRLTKIDPGNDFTIICSTAQINHHHVSHVSVSIESNRPIQQWQAEYIQYYKCRLLQQYETNVNGASEGLNWAVPKV